MKNETTASYQTIRGNTMSCVLYTKASYDYLAASETFQKAADYAEKNPPYLAVELWNLNCAAYSTRYKDTAGDLKWSKESPDVDNEFLVYLAQDVPGLWNLLERIGYQCSESKELDRKFRLLTQDLFYYITRQTVKQFKVVHPYDAEARKLHGLK